MTPILILSIVRQLSGGQGLGIHWWYFSYLAEVIQGALLSALVFVALGALLVGRNWGRVLICFFAVVYAVLVLADWFMIVYAKSRLTFLAIASVTAGANGVVDYVDARIVEVALLCIVCTGFSARIMISRRASFGRPAAAAAALIVAAVLLAQPANLLRRGVALTTMMNLRVEPGTIREKLNTHYMEAKRFSTGPLMNLVASLFGSRNGVAVGHLADSQRKVMRRFVEPAQTSARPIEPFRRIVLVTMESMTLNLTSRYNPKLPGALTPTIDSLPESLRNMRAVSLPTQFGLASHLCSHPNGAALVSTGHPNALPEYLRSKGWKTRYMQSASLEFQAGYRRFEEMGYEELIGRKEFERDARYRGYISGWGLCDRKVFEAAAEWLSAEQSQSTFLHIMTADTHSPGRRDYGDLVYPATPQWIVDSGEQRVLLESWFRADYDLGLFLAALKKNGVFDEDTVVIITGDHCYLPSNTYLALPGVGEEMIERIPWIMLTPRTLPLPLNRLTSQVDTAPTIAHLAGLRPLVGWWGNSLIDDAISRPQLAFRESDAFEILPSGTVNRADPATAAVGWVIEAVGFQGSDKPQAFTGQ